MVLLLAESKKDGEDEDGEDAESEDRRERLLLPCFEDIVCCCWLAWIDSKRSVVCWCFKLQERPKTKKDRQERKKEKLRERQR